VHCYRPEARLRLTEKLMRLIFERRLSQSTARADSL